MTDLTPEDRNLVDLARDGCEPSESDRRRVRIALVAQLGVGAGLTSASAVGAATATANAAPLGIVKIVAAVLLSSVVAGGGAIAVRHSARTTALPSPPASTSAASAPLAPPAAANALVDGVTAPAVADQPPPAKAPTMMQAPRRATPAALTPTTQHIVDPVPSEPPALAEPAAPAAPTAASPTTLDAETQLVRAGVAAMHGGDPARALAAFDEHAQQYPDGFLAEERSGERVFALCALGRTVEASEAARRFLASYPRSPLAARVRASCAATSNP
jgi:hypothetical protein